MVYAARKKIPRSKKFAGLIILAVLVLLALFGWIWHNSSTKKSAAIIPSTSPTASANKQNPPSQPSQSSSSDSAKSTAPSSTSTVSSGQGPQKPFGDFVSSHSPSSPSETIVSVCNTTPGASCYIEFTNGDEIKKLSAETADSSGAASWSWQLGQAGLSRGSWKITAVASLNGKTVSTSDPLALRVQ